MAWCGVGGTWNGTACTTDNKYNSSEFGTIAIDTIASVGALIVGFATIIALVFVYNMAKSKL